MEKSKRPIWKLRTLVLYPLTSFAFMGLVYCLRVVDNRLPDPNSAVAIAALISLILLIIYMSLSPFWVAGCYDYYIEYMKKKGRVDE